MTTGGVSRANGGVGRGKPNFTVHTIPGRRRARGVRTKRRVVLIRQTIFYANRDGNDKGAITCRTLVLVGKRPPAAIRGGGAAKALVSGRDDDVPRPTRPRPRHIPLAFTVTL